MFYVRQQLAVST